MKTLTAILISTGLLLSSVIPSNAWVVYRGYGGYHGYHGYGYGHVYRPYGYYHRPYWHPYGYHSYRPY